MPLSSSTSSVVHNMSRTLKNLILELEELGLERKDFEDLKDEQPSSESEEDEVLEELSPDHEHIHDLLEECEGLLTLEGFKVGVSRDGFYYII